VLETYTHFLRESDGSHELFYIVKSSINELSAKIWHKHSWVGWAIPSLRRPLLEFSEPYSRCLGGSQTKDRAENFRCPASYVFSNFKDHKLK
jgi:hypothetical protein